MKNWSRAPREPYQSRSEPFQIQVKPVILDQKIMQNSKAMILDSENLVESPQGVKSGENRAIPELDKTWFPWCKIQWTRSCQRSTLKPDLSWINKHHHCRRTSKDTETAYSIFRTQLLKCLTYIFHTHSYKRWTQTPGYPPSDPWC